MTKNEKILRKSKGVRRCPFCNIQPYIENGILVFTHRWDCFLRSTTAPADMVLGAWNRRAKEAK